MHEGRAGEAARLTGSIDLWLLSHVHSHVTQPFPSFLLDTPHAQITHEPKRPVDVLREPRTV